MLPLFLLAAAGPARACLLDVGVDDSTPPADYLYPNWSQALVSIYDTEWDPTAGNTDATVTGLTMLNYGTADGVTDLTKMYACFECAGGAACTPAGGLTLTYAGVWVVAGTPHPAWTWAGSRLISTDPCAACAGCIYYMRIFVDVGACPTPGATVELGPGYDPVRNPLNPGGISDALGCTAPYFGVQDTQTKQIVYSTKVADRTTVAPGDTITYSVYYGRPGTASLSSVVVTDSLPPFTHYVAGSGVPAPDTGWDPDLGPPLRLRWTIPGPLTVPGGPTGVLTFKLSVDWGNGEAFEPGSGDTAAPEGANLGNRAQVAFTGIAGCGVAGATTLPSSTTVRRFLFWKIADNDLLFASAYGKPPDDITYEIFIKNSSAAKTWWNVDVWDTVPAEIDAWCPGCGFEDPCTGWTISPSGVRRRDPRNPARGRQHDHDLEP